MATSPRQASGSSDDAGRDTLHKNVAVDTPDIKAPVNAVTGTLADEARAAAAVDRPGGGPATAFSSSTDRRNGPDLHVLDAARSA
jgi:hypothetical protein